MQNLLGRDRFATQTCPFKASNSITYKMSVISKATGKQGG